MLLIQMTGLSGAGKTSIARLVALLLQKDGKAVEVIDGDDYRKTLCKDLGFSKEDRHENIRRLGKLADSCCRQGKITIIAAINPYEEIRKELKEMYGANTVWIRCNKNELIARDTKGLYKRALLPDHHPDKVKNLTGISDVYEEPAEPDLIISTDSEAEEQSALHLYRFILAALR